MSDTFPRQYARTQRLTLGEPRDVAVTRDGSTVLFARSRGGADPVNCLWAVDVASGEERLLCDPAMLLAAGLDDLPPAERARRERMREGAGGITSYALDRAGERAVFALGGALFVCDVGDGAVRPIDVDGPVFDPRLDRAGDRIAYVRGDELWVTDLAGSATALAAEPDAPTVSWGSADFVAAEEMHRHRGFWWSPDGSAIAACRVDVSPVGVWHISDPADPAAAPRPVRYPAAGTSNPDVRLVVRPLDASLGPVEIDWDRSELEYLADVDWNEHGLAVTVQSRDQRRVRTLLADPLTGATEVLWDDEDERWVELVPGTGTLTAERTVVTCADRDGARRLMVGGEAVSPPDVQIRSVLAADSDSVTVVGNPLDDATVSHVYRWTDAGFTAVTTGTGVHAAAVGGPTTVVRAASLESPGSRWTLPDGRALASEAETPLVSPVVHLSPHTESAPSLAVLLPAGHDGSSLPVLLDPYGGPHAQRVVRSYNAFCASQWFADQGFAVVVVDGRGTPGRGTDFERAVHGDLAEGVLRDQITGLHAAADRHPELDLDRVAIRGWSFGGYLAALAVLRRPDVFHAAVAGAPVTEWRLYDTHYTERYLGDPSTASDVYDANSLLPLADRLSRPLLLIHGLADDNVVAAHSLQLSSALLAAGRPHEVLPLVGVSHMTPQEVVAENLLLHQLDFVRRALGIGPPGAPIRPAGAE